MRAPSFLLAIALSSGIAAAEEAGPEVDPRGAEASTKTRVLATGAKMLQQAAPPAQLDIHLVGLHPLRNAPEHQLVSHHFCRQVNEDFAQCALFDGSTGEANLHGIEYIISERLFEGLPAQERKYWHPHNFEILSGQLVAPGLPDAAEKALMRGKMNSYGKTWHVWNTGHFGRGDAERLPVGPAELAWSFNQEGEAAPELVESMEERLNIRTSETREKRRELIPLARPQEGVNALAGRFGRATKSLEGVSPKATPEKQPKATPEKQPKATPPAPAPR